MQLKGIGPKIASKLFRHLSAEKPTATKIEESTLPPKTTSAPTPMAIPRPRILQAPTSSASNLRTAPAKSEPSASVKQREYDAARIEAENLAMPSEPRWKVILVVDGRERKSQMVVARCQQVGIPCEERGKYAGTSGFRKQAYTPKILTHFSCCSATHW